MKRRVRGPALTKAELRARGEEAMAASTKPVVKLPTKLVRQCGRCGEFSSVMVEPGDPAPAFKCKVCDNAVTDRDGCIAAGPARPASERSSGPPEPDVTSNFFARLISLRANWC